MAGTSAVLALLFGGVGPRLLGPAVARAADSLAGDDVALDAAVTEALTCLRAGASATYSDAPDIDFATTLARHEAAVGDLARAVQRGAADRRLRRVAGRLTAAAAARCELLNAWRDGGGPESAWVASGSAVPLRFVDASLRQDLAGLPSGNGATAFVRIAVIVRRRALDLARLQMELGRDRRLKALATSLAAAATADIADLESWWLDSGRARATMAHALP